MLGEKSMLKKIFCKHQNYDMSSTIVNERHGDDKFYYIKQTYTCLDCGRSITVRYVDHIDYDFFKENPTLEEKANSFYKKLLGRLRR